MATLGKYDFAPFTCVDSRCCQSGNILSYSLSATNTGAPTAVSGMDAVSNQADQVGNKYFSATSSGTVAVYQFYVYAVNGHGISVYSP